MARADVTITVRVLPLGLWVARFIVFLSPVLRERLTVHLVAWAFRWLLWGWIDGRFMRLGRSL